MSIALKKKKIKIFVDQIKVDMLTEYFGFYQVMLTSLMTINPK